jgi:hypothetical protein
MHLEQNKINKVLKQEQKGPGFFPGFLVILVPKDSRKEYQKLVV